MTALADCNAAVAIAGAPVAGEATTTAAGAAGATLPMAAFGAAPTGDSAGAGNATRSAKPFCGDTGRISGAGAGTATGGSLLSSGADGRRSAEEFLGVERWAAEAPAVGFLTPDRGDLDGAVTCASPSEVAESEGEAAATPKPSPPASPMPNASAKPPTRPTYMDPRIRLTPDPSLNNVPTTPTFAAPPAGKSLA